MSRVLQIVILAVSALVAAGLLGHLAGLRVQFHSTAIQPLSGETLVDSTPALNVVVLAIVAAIVVSGLGTLGYWLFKLVRRRPPPPEGPWR